MASDPGAARVSTRARVVIVGAGFGGLECARKLNRAAVDVLLLDQSGYHLFTPLLYQVATALLDPSDIAYPLRALFRKSPNVRIATTTVTGIDLKRCVVHASPGEEIPYDYVVPATGSTDNYHGNEQLAENSIGLKCLEDGTRLRNHVLGCLERADFVKLEGTRILLVQRANRLLTAFSDRLGRYAERTLAKRGVEVRTKTHITAADGHQVTLSDGSVVSALQQGTMATIGRNAAVAHLRGGLELTGFAGWLAWLFVHLWYLIGFRNRFAALATWAWYYLRLNRPIRIILQTPPDPIVSTLRSPGA